MGKKPRVQTTNRQVYDKFNQLMWRPFVVLNGVPKPRVDRIISKIAPSGNITCEQSGKDVIVRKKGSANYSVYLK